MWKYDEAVVPRLESGHSQKYADCTPVPEQGSVQGTAQKDAEKPRPYISHRHKGCVILKSMETEKKPIEWEALEYEDREHGPDWFWALGIICISVAVAAVVYKNYLFAILIILAGGTLAMFAVRKPKTVLYSLTREGVAMGDTLHPWRELHSFGIDARRKDEKKLVIRSHKVLTPYIIVPIRGVDEETLRTYLEEKIPDKGHEEPITHVLFEYLGF